MSASSDMPEPATTDNDEKIINWQQEATAIINDVKMHVAHIEISTILPCSDSNIYMNIRTIEGQDFCIHVSGMGFRVAGNAYDTIDYEQPTNSAQRSEQALGEAAAGASADVENEVEIFETPYALLDKISPRYVESFGNQLCKQLLQLQQMRTQFNEEDEEELANDDDDDDADDGNENDLLKQ